MIKTINRGNSSQVSAQGHQLMLRLHGDPENQALKDEIVVLLMPLAEEIASSRARTYQMRGYPIMDNDECLSTALRAIQKILDSSGKYSSQGSNFGGFFRRVINYDISDRWDKLTHRGKTMLSLDTPIGRKDRRTVTRGQMIADDNGSFQQIETNDVRDRFLKIVSDHYGPSSREYQVFSCAIAHADENLLVEELARLAGVSHGMYRTYMGKVRKFLKDTHPELGDQLKEISAEYAASGGRGML